ncbi:MAG TPA: hypothetical protein VHO25_15630 [Polyangiaceae bacterium]|nr:hypothetical protein [Polyangiaceae bacterium]
MRIRLAASCLAVSVITSACFKDDKDVVASDPPRTGGDGDSDPMDAGRDAAPDVAGDGGQLSFEPYMIAPGSASITSVNSEDWVIFRSAMELRAVKIPAIVEAADGGSVVAANELLSTSPGSVLTRNAVVFNWADIDWDRGFGTLSVWSPGAGSQQVGPTLYSEALVAASRAGVVVFPALSPAADADSGVPDGGIPASGGDAGGGDAGSQPDSVQLMLADGDVANAQILIATLGLGSETTCGPQIDFVGERLFVGWCEPGSQVAQIQRFDRVADEWQATLTIPNVLPAWSADETGEIVFYQAMDYSAHVAEPEGGRVIDTGVSSGFLVPDGSAAFYTVGDQLRRTSLPSINPIPMVTNGYSQPVGFSPAYDLVLYSTAVSYEQGIQRDLRMVATDAFNAMPTELVTGLTASLTRSSISQDGQFVFYLSDVSPSGGLLHVVDRAGVERVVLPGVVEALAAADGRIVFTDNSSDPEVYPIVTDLKVIDLAGDAQPRLIEAKILEGRTFQLDAAKERVVYVRSGIDRDVAAPDQVGLFVQRVR